MLGIAVLPWKPRIPGGVWLHSPECVFWATKLRDTALHYSANMYDMSHANKSLNATNCGLGKATVKCPIITLMLNMLYPF